MDRPLWQGIARALSPQSGIMTQTGEFPRQAAVMALITSAPNPELIFTLRAKHLNHHAGEVCFPGGIWEQQDPSLLATALRETHEEIGVSSSLIKVLGALSQRSTRMGTVVRPFVGCISAATRYKLNLHELEELFSVPLVDFYHGLQVRTDVFEHNEQRVQIPAYSYHNREIWGFTAAVTAELLQIVRPLIGHRV